MSRPSLPDVARRDIDTVVINQLTLDSAERQHAAVERIITVWRQRPWPEALVSLTSFVGTSDPHVMTYAQWTSEQASREFMNAHRPQGVRALEQAVPGIRQPSPLRCRLYRSFVGGDAHQPPGCIVIVSIKATGPQRAREWVDAVIDALGSEPAPRPGLIAAHFHISIDGTDIVNYAEWSDEQAHRDAIDDPATEGIAQADTPQWRRVRAMSGIKQAEPEPGAPPHNYWYYRVHQHLTGPAG